MRFSVMIPEKISLNKIYAGIHFRERNRHKSEYHMAVLCSPGVRVWDGEYPVKMHYHFRLPGKQLDISNHAYMQKMVEDGLVNAGVIPGDEPRYVCDLRITAEQIGKDEEGEVLVEISPA